MPRSPLARRRHDQAHRRSGLEVSARRWVRFADGPAVLRGTRATAREDPVRDRPAFEVLFCGVEPHAGHVRHGAGSFVLCFLPRSRAGRGLGRFGLRPGCGRRPGHRLGARRPRGGGGPTAPCSKRAEDQSHDQRCGGAGRSKSIVEHHGRAHHLSLRSGSGSPIASLGVAPVARHPVPFSRRAGPRACPVDCSIPRWPCRRAPRRRSCARKRRPSCGLPRGR